MVGKSGVFHYRSDCDRREDVFDALQIELELKTSND